MIYTWYIIYIIYRLVLASGTAAAVTHTRGGGWGGVGWDVNVHVNLRQDVNVHVNGTSFTNLIQVCAVPEAGTRMMMMMMMMTMMVMMMWWWWWWWCDDDDDDDDDENDPNETCKFRTKFRPGMDKFSQPNSGGPQFQKRARGYIYSIYTVYIYIVL